MDKKLTNGILALAVLIAGCATEPGTTTMTVTEKTLTCVINDVAPLSGTVVELRLSGMYSDYDRKWRDTSCELLVTSTEEVLYSGEGDEVFSECIIPYQIGATYHGRFQTFLQITGANSLGNFDYAGIGGYQQSLTQAECEVQTETFEISGPITYE